MGFKVLILIIHPSEQQVFFFIGVSEVDKLALEDNDSVLLISWNFRNEVIDIFEHSAVQGFSFILWSVVVDGSVHEIELSLENAVRRLLSERCSDDLNEFVRSHGSILDHLKERPPDEGSAQNVSN